MCASVACEAKLLSYTLSTCVSETIDPRVCLAHIDLIHCHHNSNNRKTHCTQRKNICSKRRGCFTFLLRETRLDNRKTR